MFRIVIIFLSFLLCSFRAGDKVSIVVNNHPITEREISDRVSFIMVGQKIDISKAEVRAYLRKLASNSLIDDYLIEEGALKYKIKVTDQEVKVFINAVEDSRGFKRGYLPSLYSASKGLSESFYDKMKAELIRSKLNNQVFLRQISVEDSEVDNAAVIYGKKNAAITMREFSTSDTKDSGYKALKKIQKNNFSCNSKINSKNITSKIIESNLNELQKDDFDLVANIKQGEFSPIQERGDKLVTYLVCSKKVLQVSEEEQNNITNIIGNKKMTYKFQRFIESLRKKAFIKYM